MTPASFRAERLEGWPSVKDLDGLGVTPVTPFQDGPWLEAWYPTIGEASGASPVVVLVRAASGEAALLLPLIAHGGPARRTLAFADLGVSDYNAPLLGRASPVDPAGATAAWKAIRAVLPPADLASFTKMPTCPKGRPNPLALLGTTCPSGLSSNVLHIEEDFGGWRRRNLTRHFRKEQERAWRVFSRHEGTRFERITDPNRAKRVYADLARMQHGRITGIGLPYVLDRPAYHAFYGRLIEAGLADGSVVLTALAAGDETVAALLGIADGHGYAMVRLAYAGGPWSTCSPGRLLIEKTLAHLHGQGLRTFDFTIGDYAYKRRFNVVGEPLTDTMVALSVRGLPTVVRLKAKAFVKNRPVFDRTLHAVRKGPGRAKPPLRPKPRPVGEG